MQSATYDVTVISQFSFILISDGRTRFRLLSHISVKSLNSKKAYKNKYNSEKEQF
jgi:hypothetical protein